MFVTGLRLHNFRSYEEMMFEPGTGLNVIIGPNAAGKTNILEAIFLSALGRSHRTKKDTELINRHSHGGYVGIDLVCGVGKRSIEMRLSDSERKSVKVDGSKLTRMGELMGVMNVVMFSPEDLSIVKSAPSERRRFMDMELCQLRPTYFYRLQQYNAALKQRGSLLKDMKAAAMGTDDRLLSLWDERLAELGGDIMAVRASFMEEIGDIACELHGRITDDLEELHVFYKPDVPFSEGRVKATLYEALYSSHEQDIMRGYTTRGPHRDDIGMMLNGEDVRVFGSQGQQRTAALSLKLSELTVMKKEKREYPILLLDDVLSELDCDRQRALLSNAFECQCFLTATDLDGLEDVPDMRVFECFDGRLTRVV